MDYIFDMLHSSWDCSHLFVMLWNDYTHSLHAKAGADLIYTEAECHYVVDT